MEKPKYFVVKREENNPLWQVYISWLNKTYNQNWDGDDSLYYGYDGNNFFRGTMHNGYLTKFKNNPIVITLEHWKELFIDEEFVLPKEWYLKVTEENLEKASKWRKTMCPVFSVFYKYIPKVDCYVLSKHHYDDSYYYDLTTITPSNYYLDYKEITTEQFIKHVYNPKFKVMENKEEYVIKCLTPKHGAEIIQHFKDEGIDTKDLYGSCSEKDNYSCIYYGVINGKINNYTLKTVQSTNTLIKKLPKKELKMYSIKEVETNENLIVYLDSQKEWDKLNTITNKLCKFYKSYCYSLTNSSFSSMSSITNFGYYKNATIITINQIKELNMEKEIIGYKLIKPEYRAVSLTIMNVDNFGAEFMVTVFSCISKLKDAGVLDLWFEPVFKECYNIGDWIYIEETVHGACGVTDSVGQITEEQSTRGLLKSEEGINVKVNSEIWKIGTLDEVKIRLATKEEIAKAQEKVYTLGITEEFEIIVRDKKAFYKDEDVTKDLLCFQKNFKHLFLPYKEVNYTWYFKDLLITSVGCIKKESYLSQWIAIDLT